MDYKSAIKTSNTDTKIELRQLHGDIQFNNVSFNYPQRPDRKILSHFELTIPAGKTLAFFGGSGSGKSTVMQLIQRFYDPDEGSVAIDGYDLKHLNLGFIRSQMAIVSQEPVLFPIR